MNEDIQDPQEPTAEPVEIEAPSPQTVFIAQFDADGLYSGMAEIDAAGLTDDHVALPTGCDLPPGRYRWDKAAAAFVYAGEPKQRAEESPPALNALAWAMLAISDGGLALPTPAAAWLDAYIGTVDFAGSGSGQTEMALLAAYKKARGTK